MEVLLTSPYFIYILSQHNNFCKVVGVIMISWIRRQNLLLKLGKLSKTTANLPAEPFPSLEDTLQQQTCYSLKIVIGRTHTQSLLEFNSMFPT